MPQEELELPEKLAQTYQSRQDFAEAEAVADELSIYNLDDQAQFHTHLGIRKLQAGLDAEPQIDFLRKVAKCERGLKGRLRPTEGKRTAIYGLSRINLEMKMPETAFETVVKDRYLLREYQPELDLDIAKGLSRTGRNPSPALVRAQSHMNKSRVVERAHGIYLFIDNHDMRIRRHVEHLTLLASAYFELDYDPETFLSTAERTVERYKGGLGPTIRSLLAPAFVDCGHTDKAVALLDQIKDESPRLMHYKKRESIEKIAKSLVKKDKVDEALTVAAKTADLLFIGEIALEGAILGIGAGEDTTELIRIAADALSQPLPTFQRIEGGSFPAADYDLKRQAVLHSLYGRVLVLLHGDPSEHLSKSLEIASQIPNSSPNPFLIRADTYHGIAVNQAQSGVNATPIWEKAVSEIEHSLKGNNLDMYTYYEYEEFMERLIQAQIVCGYFDQAKGTLAKLSAFEKTNLSLLFKGEVFSDIGANRAKRGLSQTELKDLTPEQIRTILAGENVIAKQALAYFGLK